MKELTGVWVALIVVIVLAVFVLGELSYQRARRIGLNTKIMVDGIVLGMIIGFPVSHMAVVVFYHPEKVLENPVALVMFWTGLQTYILIKKRTSMTTTG